MKKTNTKFPWPEVVLIVGFTLSVVVGIAMAKYQTSTEVGILVAILIGILTTQLSIFLEQKTIQRELAFDQSLYRDQHLFDAIAALADAIHIVRQMKWPFLLQCADTYVSRIKHVAEQASIGRLENLSEEVRQIWLKDILSGATKSQVFSATSYVSIGTWWRSEAGQRYYEANVAAVRRGVKVRRVFIARDRFKDEIKQEALRQSCDGIEVRIAIEESLRPEHQANYSVLEDTIVTCSTLTPTARSSEGLVSYAPGDVERYATLFNRLWEQLAREPSSVWSDVVKLSQGYATQPNENSNQATVLSWDVKNLLYRNPSLYDKVYRSRPANVEHLCRTIFDRFLGRTPRSILDLGCGTGASLELLAKTCNDTWGVDGHGPMVEYAQRVRPTLRIKHADIRTLDLDRRFECVLMLGWVLNYSATNRDAEAAIAAAASHITPGGLLVLELLNGFSFFPGGSKRGDETFEISDPDWCAKAQVRYEFDPRKQIVRRTRYWDTPQGKEEDFCPFRLFFPAEIESLLERFGFRVLAVNDDFSLEPNRGMGESLVVVAEYEIDALRPRAAS